MFNLQHASRALIEKNYRNAIKLYETALNEIEKAKVVCVYVRVCMCAYTNECVHVRMHMCVICSVRFLL